MLVNIFHKQLPGKPMPDNPDRPFDHDTVEIRAVFVPDSAMDNVSRAEISRSVGYDAVEIPAVFVPEGGAPPGYPYIAIGEPIFRPDDPGATNRLFSSGQSSAQPSGAAQEASQPGSLLPRTRYRFGSALAGGPAGPPPDPTLPTRQNDPLRIAAGVWRSLAMATATLTRERAQSARNHAATGESAGAPDLPPDTGRREAQD